MLVLSSTILNSNTNEIGNRDEQQSEDGYASDEEDLQIKEMANEVWSDEFETTRQTLLNFLLGIMLI